MCKKGDLVELVKKVKVYEPGAQGKVTNVLSDGKVLVTVECDPKGNTTPAPLPPRAKNFFKKIARLDC